MLVQTKTTMVTECYAPSLYAGVGQACGSCDRMARCVRQAGEVVHARRLAGFVQAEGCMPGLVGNIAENQNKANYLGAGRRADQT